MQYYQTKAGKISGSDYKEVYDKAYNYFLVIKKRSKRKPYIRSLYFHKEKVFLDFFWEHVHQKQNWRDRVRRLKFFVAALELVAKTNVAPTSKDNPNEKNEILHRFFGKTREGDVFMVQVKEFKRTGQKYLISVFPT